MSRSVYEELGGSAAVEAVVDDFYTRVLDDERLVSYFEDTDMADLRAHQVQFISSVAGGPVEYDGADMREAHAHLDLGDEEFDAVAAHLEAALRENGVAESNVDAILEEVESLRAPVLGR